MCLLTVSIGRAYPLRGRSLHRVHVGVAANQRVHLGALLRTPGLLGRHHAAEADEADRHIEQGGPIQPHELASSTARNGAKPAIDAAT